MLYLKCSECGGNLIQKGDDFVCQYCGTKFKLQNTINNTYNNYNVNITETDAERIKNNVVEEIEANDKYYTVPDLQVRYSISKDAVMSKLFGLPEFPYERIHGQYFVNKEKLREYEKHYEIVIEKHPSGRLNYIDIIDLDEERRILEEAEEKTKIGVRACVKCLEYSWVVTLVQILSLCFLAAMIAFQNSIIVIFIASIFFLLSGTIVKGILSGIFMPKDIGPASASELQRWETEARRLFETMKQTAKQSIVGDLSKETVFNNIKQRESTDKKVGFIAFLIIAIVFIVLFLYGSFFSEYTKSDGIVMALGVYGVLFLAPALISFFIAVYFKFSKPKPDAWIDAQAEREFNQLIKNRRIATSNKNTKSNTPLIVVLAIVLLSIAIGCNVSSNESNQIKSNQSVVNKDGLLYIINRYASIDQTKYTTTSYNSFQQSYNLCDNLLSDTSATQQDVDDAIQQLVESENNLVESTKTIYAINISYNRGPTNNVGNEWQIGCFYNDEPVRGIFEYEGTEGEQLSFFCQAIEQDTYPDVGSSILQVELIDGGTYKVQVNVYENRGPNSGKWTAIVFTAEVSIKERI